MSEPYPKPTTTMAQSKVASLPINYLPNFAASFFLHFPLLARWFATSTPALNTQKRISTALMRLSPVKSPKLPPTRDSCTSTVYRFVRRESLKLNWKREGGNRLVFTRKSWAYENKR